MRRPSRPGAAALVIAITAFASCAQDQPERPATAGAGAIRVAPELLGTWTTSRSQDAEGSGRRIELLEDGGIGNGPALVVSSGAGIDDALGYEAVGDRITVTDDSCSSGPSEAVFSFTVDGDELTFRTIANDCPEKDVERMLIRQPWRRMRAADVRPPMKEKGP